MDNKNKKVREWQSANKEKVRGYQKKYYAKHPEQKEKSRLRMAERRKRIRAEDPEEWERMKAREKKCRDEHRENRRIYNMAWRFLNRDKVRSGAREKYKRHAERRGAVVREWQKNNPARKKSHEKLFVAIRAGVIVKPEACSSCGTPGKVDGHHRDYTKPLEVVWLCRECHKLAHKEAPGLA